MKVLRWSCGPRIDIDVDFLLFFLFDMLKVNRLGLLATKPLYPRICGEFLISVVLLGLQSIGTAKMISFGVHVTIFE